jgi:hypothetical protein
MIHPSIWQSETVASLSRDQRLLFIGLFSTADDQGRLRAHPALIRSTIFPYDDVTLADIQADLDAIEAAGFIVTYDADGKRCLQVVNWWVYQTPQWAYPSPIPPPEGWRDQLRYRQDNSVITENWKGEDEGEAIDEPLGKALPKETGKALDCARRVRVSTRVSNSDRVSEEGGATAPPRPPPPATTTSPDDVPEPQDLTVKDIEALILTDEQWQALLEREKVGKNRSTVRRHVKAMLQRPPPAVVAYREVVQRFPIRALWDGMAATVGDELQDLEFWRQVVTHYAACGWNLGNVKAMLEHYRRRELPGSNGRRAQGREPINAAFLAEAQRLAMEEDL